jgi:hypothetical protein
MKKTYIIPIILCTLFLGISGCNNKQETVVGWNADHTAYTNECNATLMEGEYYEAMNDSFVKENFDSFTQVAIDKHIGKFYENLYNETKSPIKDILAEHAQIKWVEAGDSVGRKLNIVMDNGNLKASVVDSDDAVIYEFQIDKKTLDANEKHSYLYAKLSETNEYLYFYCRRDDYIRIRITSGIEPADFKETFITFVPEGTTESNPSADVLSGKYMEAGYYYDGRNSAIKLTLDNGVVTGERYLAETEERFVAEFSGKINNGLLEYRDYGCSHYIGKFGEEEFDKELANDMSGKIFFYETFLLYKDVYSGNEFAYAYDTIDSEQNN